MGKTTRFYIKREIGQAIYGVDRVINQLVYTFAPFEEHHPNLYHECAQIVANLNLIKGQIEELDSKI